MELLQLKYFKAVAEIGKISAAAQQLFISAPALSTSISRLEKELGMPLFTRTNNRIVLNAQGQILLRYVNQAFSALDNAKEELRQSLLSQDSHISILSINTIMWTNLIAVFTAENPHITLSCTPTTPSVLAEKGLSPQFCFLLAAEYDVPQRYEEELDSIHLLNNYPMVMLNSSHRLAKEKMIAIDMLSKETIFMPSSEHSLQQRICRLFEESNIPVPVDKAYAFLVRQQMVSMNLGVSFTSKYTSEYASEYASYSTYPNIVYVPLADTFHPLANRLYWRKNHVLTNEERIFRDFAKAFFTDLH